MTQPQKNRVSLNGPIDPDTPTPKRPLGKRIFAIVLILVILVGGIFLSRMILESKPKAERKKRPKMQTLVQVQQVSRIDTDMYIDVMGTILPAQEIDLKPRVSGTVVTIHPELLPGGLLNQGDTVLSLDPRDFEIAYDRSLNALEQATMDLRIEQGSQAVAKREYDLIKEYSDHEIPNTSVDLALRQPQLTKAKAAESAAKSNLMQAKLNLERTALKAPFNALVIEKNVAPGSQINSQTSIAKLIGTDTYWLRVAIAQEELNIIHLPSKEEPGSTVLLTLPSASLNTPFWEGKVIRLLGDVDPKGLMARLLIEIPQNQKTMQDTPPLLLGSMVKARVVGKPLIGNFEIPRKALRADNTVLIATPEETLEIRPVTIGWQNESHAYIQKGLEEKERVITSAVAAPIQGMSIATRKKTNRSENTRPKSD